MAMLLKDLRFALRMLQRSPGFAATAILTLAVGIGACTVVFSSVYGLLYRPLPFDESNRLVVVQGTYPGLTWFDAHTSHANYVDLKEQSTSLEDLAAYEIASFNFTEGAHPERITAIKATSNIFSVLGVAPAHGRGFNVEEDRPGAGKVALLNDGFWRSRLGADPDVVGRDLTVHNEVYRIVGVLPPEVEEAWIRSDIWVPLASGLEITSRHDNNLRLIGRRNPGMSVKEVGADLDVIMQRIEEAYPLLNGGRVVRVTTVPQTRVSESRSLAVRSLTMAVGFVLLIACCNVANLMLARATSRAKEMAIRAAMGAGRARLIRQLLTESTLLAAIAGVFGILLAFWGVEIVATSQEQLPSGRSPIRVDALALIFTLLLSLATAALFGLIPALRSSRLNLAEALKAGARGATGGSRRSGLRGALIVGEIALAVVLVVAAGLMIQSFIRLQNVDPGFEPAGLLAMRISLPDYGYGEEHRQRTFFQNFLAELEELPQVESAAAVDAPPLVAAAMTTFRIEGRPVERPMEQLWVGRLLVTENYWETMRVPLAAGRGFLEADDAGGMPVVVVNEAMATRFWPNDDPIGKRVNFGGPPGEPWYTVVGVASNDLHWDLREEAQPEVFVPFRQMPDPEMFVVIRTGLADPLSLAGSVRETVWRVDPALPVFGFRTMDAFFERQISPWQSYAGVLSVFSVIALILAAVGIYGVMSYMVSQRTHEFGLRMAVGAQVREILWLVLRRGAFLTHLGLLIGLAGAAAATRLLSTLLFGVTPTDLPTYAAVIILLGAVALLACYVPARKAARVDPIETLRGE
jgi:putative ABC transport system permease protein